MGGIVTRRMMTRPGDVFWEAAFTQPLGSLEESEKIVPAGHDAFKHEEAMAEIVRILELPPVRRKLPTSPPPSPIR
jgi:hypothetical protein